MRSTTSPLVAAQPHPDGPGYPEPMTTAPGLPTTDLSHAQPHVFGDLPGPISSMYLARQKR
jgi:hypothetical protein